VTLQAEQTTHAQSNWAEKTAYWYLRLNGFLQIENFIVHPTVGVGQRTEVDLLAVRFPHRAERWFDDRPMADDDEALGLSATVTDVVIAEVKGGNRGCRLNGPWTNPDLRNMHRVLAAIGCLPFGEIESAADALRHHAAYLSEQGLRVRLLAFGATPNRGLSRDYEELVQLTWGQVLDFIWRRFNLYRDEKALVRQWDDHGQELRFRAYEAKEGFIDWGLDRVGVRTLR
jgi:hypothetical protein